MADQLMLEIFEANYKEGDKLALIWALERCCREGGDMPPWVSEAFCAAVSKVRNFEAGSWDDVFGQPHKGSKVTLLRQKRDKRWEVVNLVNQHRLAGEKGDSFQSAADQIGVSRGTAKRYYDEIYGQGLTRPKKKGQPKK